jgi:hypothetical protein
VNATRRRLLLAAGVAPAAFVAAAAAAPASDAEILERLVALERRLEGAYDAALRRGVLDEELALSLRDQEREHARGLELALEARGGRAAGASRRDPGLAGALRARRAFARYALALELTAVRVYVDAAAALRDARLRQSLGAIMTNEAQHEVALRESLGEPLLGV